MDVRFYQDPDGQAHVQSHGVTEQEVIRALLARGEDRPGREGSRVAIGHTAAGRVLRIIYRILDDRTVFVITAYDLRGKPLIAYRRRRRQRGR